MLSAEMTWPMSDIDGAPDPPKSIRKQPRRICQALSLVFWVTTQSRSAAVRPARASVSVDEPLGVGEVAAHRLVVVGPAEPAVGDLVGGDQPEPGGPRLTTQAAAPSEIRL